MTDKFTAVIIDDEPHAIELLETAIGEVTNKLAIIDRFTSWSDALKALSEKSYDIIFLDVSMKGKNGMDLVSCVPNLQSEVIFITAHSDYALQAFKLSAAGYILKPIDNNDLAKILYVVCGRLESKKLAGKKRDTALSDIKIGIPTNKAIRYIFYSDIIYLEAMNAYTKVILRNEEILCSYNIGKFNKLLTDHMFFTIHRSYTINLHHVSKYNMTGSVQLSNGKELPISKNLRDNFLQLFSRITAE